MMTSTAKSTTISSLDNIPTASSTTTTTTTKKDHKPNINEDILTAAAMAAAADPSEESEQSETSEQEEETETEVQPSEIEETNAESKPKNHTKKPKNESTHLLTTMLKEHRCQEMVLRRRWKKLRNQREALTIAASLDARKRIQIDEEDVDILISRLQALFLADYTKSWEVAQHLEKVPQPGAEIIPDVKLQKALKRSELYKKAMQPNKTTPKKQEAEEDDDE
jgi:hypothetical protein